MTEKKYNPKAIAKTIDVEELYDLDVTIARFILPRLMVFKSLHQGHLEQRGRPGRPQACRQGLAQAHQRRPVALPQVLPQPVVVNHFFR